MNKVYRQQVGMLTDTTDRSTSLASPGCPGTRNCPVAVGTWARRNHMSKGSSHQQNGLQLQPAGEINQIASLWVVRLCHTLSFFFPSPFLRA